MTKRRKSFTLVELLIAIGLLSLIMMLLLQLFSGAQKIWTSSEKTNNVYTDARVAMELMADELNTVQFSCGEKVDAQGAAVRDPDKDMIFSLDTEEGTDNDSCSVIFAAKRARDDNAIRFVSFRRGSGDDHDKLLMLVYSRKINERNFYGFFPPYKNHGSKRDTALSNLKSTINGLISTDDTEFCQVIAENVVAFKLTAYRLTPVTTDADGNITGGGELLKMTAEYTIDGTSVKCKPGDVREPPYMIEIQLTLLDHDSFGRWNDISDTTAKKNYLKQHQRTFTRNVYLGDRWALEKKALSGSTGN